LALELRQHKFDTALPAAKCVRCCLAGLASEDPERIGYARDGRTFLLTKAVASPPQWRIPRMKSSITWNSCDAPDGWIPCRKSHSSVLRIPEEKSRRAEEFLAFWRAQGAVRIAIGAGASYGSAKCMAPSQFAEVANRLQSEANADVICLDRGRSNCLDKQFPVRCADLRSISPEKPQSPDLPALLSGAIFSLQMILAPCTLPLL